MTARPIYRNTLNHWRDEAQHKARTIAIHRIARFKGLIDGKDRDAYEAMLSMVTGGKTSTKACTVEELGLVLDHLNNRRGESGPISPAAPQGAEQQFGKIAALLTAGGKPWAYAEGIARKMHGKDALQFCTGIELRGVIAALERQAARTRAKAAG